MQKISKNGLIHVSHSGILIERLDELEQKLEP
jgi:hypothetical protein